MRCEIEIRAIRNPHQLAPLASWEAEAILDIHCPLRVMAQLLFRMLEEAQIVWVHPEVDIPSHRLVDPILVPTLVGTRLDEEFHLHLLELARAEDEVTGRDLVAERLAYLPDSEGRLYPARTHHVREIDEDSLRGLRS